MFSNFHGHLVPSVGRTSAASRASRERRASEARPESFRGKGCRGKFCRRGRGARQFGGAHVGLKIVMSSIQAREYHGPNGDFDGLGLLVKTVRIGIFSGDLGI